MPRCGNGDLRIEVEPQNSRGTADRKQEAVKGDVAQLRAGYATLDQADNGEYGNKERRGLARDANWPKRY